MRVLSLDQIDLPCAWPFLHGFFALDSFLHVAEFLEPDEPMHLVFAREAGPFSGAVLLHSEDDAVGDAGIEGSSRFAGEDVDPVAAHGASRNWRTEYAARWIAGTSPAMTCAAQEASK